jgi:hypothetical protein
VLGIECPEQGCIQQRVTGHLGGIGEVPVDGFALCEQNAGRAVHLLIAAEGLAHAVGDNRKAQSRKYQNCNSIDKSC